MNTSIYDTPESASLCFLTWLDTLERMDTIILEARHLQENLIYSLGDPTLYETLQMEEDLLWGKRGAQAALVPDQREYWQAIEKNMPLYKGIGEVDKSIQDTWSSDQRRHYYSLYSIQVLKRDICLDRLFLNHIGLKAFKLDIEPGKRSSASLNPDMIPLFLLRSILWEKIRKYLVRIGDIQAHFSKSQDMGMHDHPRPLLERRREQNTYSRYLDQQCRDILDEMHLLWNSLDIAHPQHSIYADNGSGEPEPLRPTSSTLHRWQHIATSEAESFIDETTATSSSNIWIHFINTSYWMPERPELLPTIAHEVAHAFIAEHLNGLDEAFVGQLTNPFSFFIKMIIRQCSKPSVLSHIKNFDPSYFVIDYAVSSSLVVFVELTQLVSKRINI